MTPLNSFFKPLETLNCRGRLLDISRPVVMGVLNVTPDSFYEESRVKGKKKLLKQAEKMLRQGATILDIGGMSSRPGAKMVDEKEEMKRVIPAVRAVVEEFPDAFVSVDTVRAKVTQSAIEAGACIVNDISAGSIDGDLINTVAGLNVPYILMHMQGLPENMQDDPQYGNVTEQLLDFFTQKIAVLHTAGIRDVIIDPGFGFGKTVAQNYELLNRLDEFKIFNLPVLAGISRKSMICKLLKRKPKSALNGTTIAHTIALQKGAKILRVHDVKEAMEVVKMVGYMHELTLAAAETAY